MSSLESSCAVISSGMLLCVDQITQSLYTVPLQSTEQKEMKQIHLQVHIYCIVYVTIFSNNMQLFLIIVCRSVISWETSFKDSGFGGGLRISAGSDVHSAEPCSASSR